VNGLEEVEQERKRKREKVGEGERELEERRRSCGGDKKKRRWGEGRLKYFPPFPSLAILTRVLVAPAPMGYELN
jgi:hypothetical protein